MIEILIYFIITIIFIIFSAFIPVYLKNRILTLFQSEYTGKIGCKTIIQGFADSIKLILKEDCTPKTGKFLYFISPLIVFCPVITAFCLLPPAVFYTKINTLPTAVLFLALVLIPLIGMLLAAYTKNTEYPPIETLRKITQILSVCIPLSISIFAVAFFAGTLNINGITLAQSSTAGLFGWYFIPQIIGCITFFICMLIFLNRMSLNSENKLTPCHTAGYSGLKFALFIFSKNLLYVLFSIFFVCLFLGGYLNPFGTYVLPDFLIPLEQIFWLFLKTFFVIFFTILTENILSISGYDRILEFSYKILLPLSLINLNIAILIRYFTGT